MTSFVAKFRHIIVPLVLMLLGDISLVEKLEKDAVLVAQPDAVKGLEAMKLLLGYCTLLDINDKVGNHLPSTSCFSYKLICVGMLLATVLTKL